MKKIILTLTLALFSFTAINALTEKGNDKAELTVDVVKPVKTAEIYVYEVHTTYGTIKGSAPTLEKAERIVKLANTNDVYSYKIIASGKIEVVN